MNEEKQTKSLIVELENAKMNFTQFINSLQQKGIPCYLIDMTLSDVYAQLKNSAKAELAMARKQAEDGNHENCEH